MVAGWPVPLELCTSGRASLWDCGEEATEELLKRRLLNLLSVLLRHAQLLVIVFLGKVRQILNRVVAQRVHLANEFRGCILDVPEIDEELHQLSFLGRRVRNVLSGLASHDGDASCFLSGDRRREDSHEHEEGAHTWPHRAAGRCGGRPRGGRVRMGCNGCEWVADAGDKPDAPAPHWPPPAHVAT